VKIVVFCLYLSPHQNTTFYHNVVISDPNQLKGKRPRKKLVCWVLEIHEKYSNASPYERSTLKYLKSPELFEDFYKNRIFAVLKKNNYEKRYAS